MGNRTEGPEMMQCLRCIGRTDSLGYPDPWGSNVGFVYELPGGPRHTIVLEEAEAENLVADIERVIWPDQVR